MSDATNGAGSDEPVVAASDRQLIGKTEDEARSIVTGAGLKFRLRSRDGQNFLGTCDLCMDRVNVEVRDGKVISVGRG